MPDLHIDKWLAKKQKNGRRTSGQHISTQVYPASVKAKQNLSLQLFVLSTIFFRENSYICNSYSSPSFYLQFHIVAAEHGLADEPQVQANRIFGAVVAICVNCNLVRQVLSTMNLGFLGNIPWFKAQSNIDLVTTLVSTKAFTEQPKQKSSNDPKLTGWPLSFLSLFPWANNAREKFQRPSTINKELKRHAQTRGNVVGEESVTTPLRFRPYVCKVPWHTGVRAFLSQLFPRYGHYCGPNWSSGKDHGSLVWDKRPIDWLDFCCYCHDMGYDTLDQAKLLKADLAFLECLEKQHMSTKGDPHIAHLYKTMCINGLKNFLIPYRRHLVNLQQSGQPLIQFGWLSNLRWRSWNFQKT